MSGVSDTGAFSKPADAIDLVQTILQAPTEYSIIGQGLDGTILLWNAGAERRYGYQAEELVGKAKVDTLHTPRDVAAGLPDQMRQTALADGRWEGTVTHMRRDAAASPPRRWSPPGATETGSRSASC